MTRLFRSTVAVPLLVLAAGCVQIYNGPQGGPSPGAAAGAQEKEDEEKDKDKPRFEKWDEVLKDTEEIEGFLTFHRKRDNTLLLEVAPERLGEDFGLVMHYSRGAGDFNIQEGLPLSDTRLMRLRRTGDKVQLLHVNPRFTAGDADGYREGLEANVGHSVVAAWDIKSEHEETKHLLVDVTKFFTSDYPAVADWLKFYYGGKPLNLDADRSHVGRILAFPENVELDAELTYAAGSEPELSGGYGVSDTRSIPVGVRYSLFALPEEPMTPRLADDRVGYFLDAVWDFSRDQREEAFRRYVSRWRLEKKDPHAEVSEPVEPIVYYVDPSVPEAYRRYVKEGIEAWNKAFEAAGFRNAVVAKDPPANDTTWSAEDVRYSTVRWTPGYNMWYAIGPSQSDPRTGEILNADILISANFLRAWVQEYRDFVGAEGGTPLAAPPAAVPGPGRDPAASFGYGGLGFGRGPGAGPTYGAGGLQALFDIHDATRRGLAEMPRWTRERLCFAQAGKAHQLAVGLTFLAALGEIPEELPEEYVGSALRDLVMHEVGHTLGLRHNFKGSSAIPHDRLNDEAFTREHGLTLSVMDYGPVNVSPDRSRQGHYWNQEVGSYDVWAIRYGYSVIYEQGRDGPPVTSGTPVTDPEEELVGLRKIAAQASDPMHAYNTDEDTWLGSFSVDPLTNPWDLGSDAMAYARDRARIVARVLPRLEERLLSDGDRYHRLRNAATSLIFERFISLVPVTKTVGGLYFHRDHKGDPGGRPPFVPVPAERQREAVRFVVDQMFDEDAFAGFSPELLNRLAPERYWHWGMPFFQLPVDFPIHSYVLLVQRALLQELLAAPRLWRMIDNEARVPPERLYRASELFETLTAAIWSELGLEGGGARPVGSFRRNLQRVHLEILGGLLLDRPAGFPTASVPEDGRSLARRELSALSRRIADVLQAGTGDAMTRAHLEESKARIDRFLEVSLHLPAE